MFAPIDHSIRIDHAPVERPGNESCSLGNEMGKCMRVTADVLGRYDIGSEIPCLVRTADRSMAVPCSTVRRVSSPLLQTLGRPQYARACFCLSIPWRSASQSQDYSVQAKLIDPAQIYSLARAIKALQQPERHSIQSIKDEESSVKKLDGSSPVGHQCHR